MPASPAGTADAGPRRSPRTPEDPPNGWPTPDGRLISKEERARRGRGARSAAPRSSHAVWAPGPDRRDPVDILTEQASTRVPELVPLRNARMVASPFAFFRGSAAVMAADLASTPSTGLPVQLCGDAHLSNFGGYASPDRSLVFDLNDFDETLPGPWEWDVKRLVASVAIAGRSRGFSDAERRAAVLATAAAYRSGMHEFAGAGNLQVWYSRVTVDDIRDRWASAAGKRARRRFDKQIEKAMTKDSALASSRLTRRVDGRHEMISDPPLVVPVRELFGHEDASLVEATLRQALHGYRRTLTGARRHLIEQFHYVDAARKVVGVGSVGTRAWVALMVGNDNGEPLLLQVKEADPSVLAPFAGRSRFDNQGQRVVMGQQLLQASSDILLGWTRITPPDGTGAHDFHIRQLWDWKISADVEKQSQSTMAIYGQLCGWTLARGHARSGDRVAIAAYLGKGAAFDAAMADFAEAYADQNELDHGRFAAAVNDGRVDARA